jgi:hypothetical protein
MKRLEAGGNCIWRTCIICTFHVIGNCYWDKEIKEVGKGVTCTYEKDEKCTKNFGWNT